MEKNWEPQSNSSPEFRAENFGLTWKGQFIFATDQTVFCFGGVAKQIADSRKAWSNAAEGLSKTCRYSRSIKL